MSQSNEKSSLFDYVENRKTAVSPPPKVAAIREMLPPSPPLPPPQPPSPPQQQEQQQPLSVSELTGTIKQTIEEQFDSVYVVGQISNLSRPRSGHLYFTLKDEGAQLPTVMWKSAAARIKISLQDGMEVRCRGRLDVYPPQGKYQLQATAVEPSGIGTLELAFRQLQDKLHREGLFDAARKKPLPRFVRKVAVITSFSGAAIRDFLQVLRRRTQQVDVLIIPVRVQGEGASLEIAAALNLLNRENSRLEKPVDVCVLTRGGGSIEDLWSFNEEPLVRAVAASDIPVISAVGHEIDVTLCDFAADIRALTPSEAAERVSPDDTERWGHTSQLRRLLTECMAARLHRATSKLEMLRFATVLTHPERMLEHRLMGLSQREERLDQTIQRHLDTKTQLLANYSGKIHALSPLAVLARGYSVTRKMATNTTVAHLREVVPGDSILTILASGTIESVAVSCKET